MIRPGEIQRKANAVGVRDQQIEKDYILSWILFGISKHEQLSKAIVFKGGTVLKKVYFEDYRFSEDLDFTLVNAEVSNEQIFAWFGRKPNCRMTSRKIVPCCEKKMINKEEFLKLAEAKYAEIHALKDEPTFLDYERGFVELWTELGRQVLQSELGDPGVDRRKKKDLDNPGENRAKKD
jgi:hypothetical protein